jgi:hypothetical protein
MSSDGNLFARWSLREKNGCLGNTYIAHQKWSKWNPFDGAQYVSSSSYSGMYHPIQQLELLLSSRAFTRTDRAAARVVSAAPSIHLP